ncbi:MAG: Crp/Fnr family transcriptional regulator [Gemmatimonadota bacterium]
MITTLNDLSGIPALARLRHEDRVALAGRARSVRYAPGQRLVPLASPPRQLLILLDGLAKVSGVTGLGDECIVAIHRPGDLIDSSLFAEPSMLHCECIALRPVRAAVVSRPDFLALAREHPAVLVAVAQEVSANLVRLTNRMMMRMSLPVPARLCQALLDFAEVGGGADDVLVPLTHRLTQETMAGMIGASRPYTSVAIRDLETVGALQRKSSRGLLVRRSQLRAMVQAAR